MTLRLYDSATAALQEFKPLTAGRVGLYVCGATVQAEPHIGHLRSALAFDQLWRWLEIGHGYDVTFIRNVTDIDDKILAKSAAAQIPWWAWALQHERAFTAAYDTVGVRRPTYEPRATAHVVEMVELIERLIARGHAYRAEDDSSDVFFDVRSWPDYGSLTRQRLDELSSPDDDAAQGKRRAHDFALWKSAVLGEPQSAAWRTPFGAGRPGWHLSCSAMARRYLGDEFDIHGGGLDLRFPHHENEQAQSRAAGYSFARHWLHNGLVTMSGEKMSKSLGNALPASTALTAARPLDLRYYLGAANYKSTIDFHESSLVDAATAMRRIEGFLSRASESNAVDPVRSSPVSRHDLPKAFSTAMDDDLNVPAALAVLHEAVATGNSAFDRHDRAQLRQAWQAVSAMTDVLGINPSAAPWSGSSSVAANRTRAALNALVGAQLELRSAARATGDWTTADAVREIMAQAGVKISDGPNGTSWRLADQV